MFVRSTLVALLAFSSLTACEATPPRDEAAVPHSRPPDDDTVHASGTADLGRAHVASSQAGSSALADELDAVESASLSTPGPRAHATGRSAAITPATARARLDYEQNTVDVFRSAAPATVFVTQSQLMRDRWSRRALEVPTGSGSGFVWDRAGHIVTNAHVIASNSRRTTYSVTLYDGESYEAELVGRDDQKDIAVLKLNGSVKSLVPIVLPPEKSRPEVGQKALAIGNPFGLDHTLTVGVVSALDREVRGFGNVTIRGMIQTDASINPGNSGGPLLNASGQLLGMNTIIFSKSGSSAGIGFAVPVNIIRRVVPQLIEYGEPLRIGLGVALVGDDIARANGIRGVVIDSVRRGSGAAKAGLRGLRRTNRGMALGDVIVAVDGKSVETFDDLYTVVDDHKPGDTVPVVVLRNNKRVTVNVTLTPIAGGR